MPDATGGESAGLGYAEAQTQAVTTVIFFQIFYLLNCRSFREPILQMGLYSNPWIFVGIGAVLLLQAAFVYLPFMNAVFGSAPLGLSSMGRGGARRRADHAGDRAREMVAAARCSG